MASRGEGNFRSHRSPLRINHVTVCLSSSSDFDLPRDGTGSGHGWEILNADPGRRDVERMW